mmetsp:Transcript_16554/g.32657  ORF Transcript_16554/g.32657 Transcript_16554/m.32657 type:complete len:204 (+) Transcript_16554:1393-2004(+)
MQRCSRTSSMNLLHFFSSEWLSQQHPLTTWFSWRTRRPDPFGGAWVKTKIFQPSVEGCSLSTSSNHTIWASSMVTSCEVYLASLKTVEPSPTRSVFSAIRRLNCAWGLLCSLRNISRLAASVSNSSRPSRSWLPPMTSYGTPKDPRYSAAILWHSVVPAKSSEVSAGRTDLDSPRSPRDTIATFPCCSLAASRVGIHCFLPVS